MKSNGKHSKKVFKISESKFAPLEKKSITRKQRFKDFTTRKHYPGEHKIAIIINGIETKAISFYLA